MDSRKDEKARDQSQASSDSEAEDDLTIRIPPPEDNDQPNERSGINPIEQHLSDAGLGCPPLDPDTCCKVKNPLDTNMNSFEDCGERVATDESHLSDTDSDITLKDSPLNNKVVYLPDAILTDSETDDVHHSLTNAVEDATESNASMDHLQDMHLSDTAEETTTKAEPSDPRDQPLPGTKVELPQKSRHVTFDLDDVPSTSHPLAGCSSQELEGNNVNAIEAPAKRLYNMLEMLYRFANTLDNIDQSRLSSSQSETQFPVSPKPPESSELGTQTADLSSVHGRQRIELMGENPPPCERLHHTIIISGNHLPPNPPVVRQTICARIGRSIYDFAAAFCMCLQVNKDCVFCLGFFVAFVVSASFLTAFFYRTLNFSTAVVRPVPAQVMATQHFELGTVRFNKGYYYVYNKRPT